MRYKLSPAMLDFLKMYGHSKTAYAVDHEVDLKFITHHLSRIVMRNPNQTVKTQLKFIHEALRKEFYEMPDEEIDWLLGSTHLAHGSFKNSQALKKFLENDFEKMTTSRLMTAIESLLTAMAYRAIDSDTGTPPIKPSEFQTGYVMHKKLHALLDGKFLPYINDLTYTTRKYDRSDSERTPVTSAPIDISDLSDKEDDTTPEKAHGSEISFHVSLNEDLELKTWPCAAKQSGVPFRAHISGTVPLCLTVLDQLYNQCNNDWFFTERNCQMLSGCIFLPTYERADYHTIAETAAGVMFFIDAKANKMPEALPPKAGLENALLQFSLATEGEISQNIKQIAECILPSIPDIIPRTSLSFEEALSIVRQSLKHEVVAKIVDHFTSEILQLKNDIEDKEAQLTELMCALEENKNKSRGVSQFFKHPLTGTLEKLNHRLAQIREIMPKSHT